MTVFSKKQSFSTTIDYESHYYGSGQPRLSSFGMQDFCSMAEKIRLLGGNLLIMLIKTKLSYQRAN